MNEHLKDWLEALRSGKYEQGWGRLIYRDNSGEIQHCCLGVLCVISPITEQIDRVDIGGLGYKLKGLKVDGKELRRYEFTAIPPFETIDILDLPPQMKDIEKKTHDNQANVVRVLKSLIASRLAKSIKDGENHNEYISVQLLNDKYHATFAEIADAIEATYNHLTQ